LINLDFIQGLRDDKRATLLAALMHKTGDEFATFRHQIAFAIEPSSEYLESLVSPLRFRPAHDQAPG
jgi:hypothetical protein